MSVLHIMVGIPASGKSTYARKLAGDTGAIVLSSDAIRKELTGSEECDPSMNSTVFGILQHRLAKHIADTDVIIDATSTHVRDWRKYISLCPPGITVKLYWFDIPPEVALERMKGRERKVPVEVIENMWHCMEQNRVHLGEYFSEDNITVITPEMH